MAYLSALLIGPPGMHVQLIENGRVVRPYIGIKMLQLNSGNVIQLRKRDPSFPDVVSGILVPHVTVASPAHKAGLRPGDVITGASTQIYRGGFDKQGIPLC